MRLLEVVNGESGGCGDVLVVEIIGAGGLGERSKQRSEGGGGAAHPAGSFDCVQTLARSAGEEIAEGAEGILAGGAEDVERPDSRTLDGRFAVLEATVDSGDSRSGVGEAQTDDCPEALSGIGGGES